MSDKNQRRPLTPPAVPPVSTPTPEKASGTKSPPETTSVEPPVEETAKADTALLETVNQVEQHWDISGATLTSDEMQNMRAAALDIKRQFDDMVRAYWHLPLSRETIFSAGGMSATFDKLVGFIERDATDYAMTTKE